MIILSRPQWIDSCDAIRKLHDIIHVALWSLPSNHYVWWWIGAYSVPGHLQINYVASRSVHFRGILGCAVCETNGLSTSRPLPNLVCLTTVTRYASDIISMARCKTVVTPLLTHWSYCSLALGHRYGSCGIMVAADGPVPTWYQCPSAITRLIFCRSVRFTRRKQYGDVMMGAIASQITSLTIVYSTVYSGTDQRKTSKLRVTGLCARNSPGTGEFPAQMASYAETVSISWRHHGYGRNWHKPLLSVKLKQFISVHLNIILLHKCYRVWNRRKSDCLFNPRSG